MKCDELEKFDAESNADLSAGYDHRYSYEADEVDAAIAELKAKLDRAIAERDGNQVCIDALKQKLENAQASMYCDVVDANMENRRLQRALYNLRAVYADMMQKRYIECKTDGWVHRVNKWIEVERRCRVKSKEYL